jgi:hypothetical protein
MSPVWRIVLAAVLLSGALVGAAFYFAQDPPEMDRVRYGHAYRPSIEAPNYERPEDEREPVRYRL